LVFVTSNSKLAFDYCCARDRKRFAGNKSSNKRFEQDVDSGFKVKPPRGKPWGLLAKESNTTGALKDHFQVLNPMSRQPVVNAIWIRVVF